MSEWIYKDEDFIDIPDDIQAFVYRIDIGGKFYIGKKNFWKKIKRPPLKGYKRVRRDIVQSNWKKYCSSSDEVKKLVEEGYTPTRTILRLCSSQKEATFFETKLLFELIDFPDCINGNIGGKYFKPEIVEWYCNE